MRLFLLTLILVLSSVLLTNCEQAATASQASQESTPTPSTKALLRPTYHPDPQFNQYWYKGVAEMNRYSVKQARYGEVHQGEVVNIFVTESIDPNTHIKPNNANKSAIPVLKLNQSRKFHTGIYPYTLMTSVFTPVHRRQNPNTAKVSFTGQDWCGHVFAMLNLEKQHFTVTEHSYFEGEGDAKYSVDATLLEDEMPNFIRIDPKNLPSGELEMIPALHFLRMKHHAIKPYKVKASITTGSVTTYKLSYPELNREVTYRIERSFPYKIVGWTDRYESGWGNKKQMLTTEATLVKTMLLDYWSKNSLADSTLRRELGTIY